MAAKMIINITTDATCHSQTKAHNIHEKLITEPLNDRDKYTISHSCEEDSHNGLRSEADWHAPPLPDRICFLLIKNTDVGLINCISVNLFNCSV